MFTVDRMVGLLKMEVFLLSLRMLASHRGKRRMEGCTW